ncbi:MAG TPA: methylated-DNA--[protein]-cysteine S-methyltransferase [Anaerolineales bacterium]|nr:methylated-DNA--[protein]-cysteine S-methyltransferase [Anaerolineales bacterium]
MKTAWIGILETSPLGPVWVAVSELGLVAVEVDRDRLAIEAAAHRLGFEQVIQEQENTSEAVSQIAEYLAGKRRIFDLAIDWAVLRPFQQEALHATFEIPYGESRTYGEIAHSLGRPRAARAVGRAEATNPMPLVIPCHRVIGADGGLHGYGAGNGLETKEWLLNLEKASR